MNLQVVPIKEISEEKEKVKIDQFIMDYNGNGEFINTIKYLSYHSEDRFTDDSIIIKDFDSGNMKGVIMAASKKDEEKKIISHPGTTFAGVVLNRKIKVDEMDKLLDLALLYYSRYYEHIELKLSPAMYSAQPNQILEYMLLKKGFKYEFNALANIIDLSKIKKESEIFNLYNSKRRNQVNKVIKENKYCFRNADIINSSIWESMNHNINDKFRSQTTHSYEEITKLKDKFQCYIFPYETNRNDNEYGAFALVYKFKNVFHTQYLDMNYKVSRDYPNLLLIHELIKVATQEGYKYFSFGASTENSGGYLNEGLYHYKSGFGGGEILFPVYKKELK